MNVTMVDVCIVIVTVIFAICTGILLIINRSLNLNLKKLRPLASNITYEEKENAVKIVNEAIDTAIYKVLGNLVNKDLTFTPNSPTQHCLNGKYRDLIECLNNPNYKQSFINPDGSISERTFSGIFIERVFLHYLSDNCSAIKDQLFKFHSGYNQEDYQESLVNPKVKQSALPYVMEHVTYWLTNKYAEVKAAEALLFEKANNVEDPSKTAELYKIYLEQFDKRSVSEIYLNIYHIYGVGVNLDVIQNTPKKPVNKMQEQPKKEVNNEFAVSFNEQNK